jgi:hypothetical protein
VHVPAAVPENVPGSHGEQEAALVAEYDPAAQSLQSDDLATENLPAVQSKQSLADMLAVLGLRVPPLQETQFDLPVFCW